MTDYDYKNFKELQTQARQAYLDKYNAVHIPVDVNTGINVAIKEILENYALVRLRSSGVFCVSSREGNKL
jgi:hypothetical protein